MAAIFPNASDYNKAIFEEAQGGKKLDEEVDQMNVDYEAEFDGHSLYCHY